MYIHIYVVIIIYIYIYAERQREREGEIRIFSRWEKRGARKGFLRPTASRLLQCHVMAVSTSFATTASTEMLTVQF